MNGNAADPQEPLDHAAESLSKLQRKRPELAESIARLTGVVASEAVRSPRFADALAVALRAADLDVSSIKRAGRRSPGAIDPFHVYAEFGEDELRVHLADLGLEQLRDIIAEHGMDHDKLAMKWKSTDRVIDRIVDKVLSRAAKGSAFRPPPAR